MELYQAYFEMLREGAGHVGWLCIWTGLALLGFVLTGIWLPLTQMRDETSATREKPADWTRLDWTWGLPVALAAGMASSVTCWTLSFFATGRLLAGGVALVIACLIGLAIAWRRRCQLKFQLSHPITWGIVTVLALLLGLWHHAGTELPLQRANPQLLFTHLQGDTAIHVHLAGMIQDGGLPLQNIWGSREHAYADLLHTGHVVLLAGLSTSLGVSLYQASVVLWIAAMLLIAWGVLGLLADTRMPCLLRFILSLGTLVWGAFTFPNFHALGDPLRSHAGDLEVVMRIAARGFWNISQTLSTGLTLAGMLLLDRIAMARRRRSMGLATLSAAAWFFVVGGWTKPSLVIFCGPALLIWMLLNRGNLREWACVLLLLAVGVLVYMLPALLARLPQHPSWSVALDTQQWGLVGKFLCLAAASLLVLAAEPLRRLFLVSWRDCQWHVVDLALIATGGSLLFALLFREDRVVHFSYTQPNIWWGPSACVVMLVPLLGREAWAALERGGWRRPLAIIGLLMAMVQIVNGACFAVVYPVLQLRTVAQSMAETLDAARNQTTPGTRFAIDPVLHQSNLVGYLARPVLFARSYTPKEGLEDLIGWQEFCLLGRRPKNQLMDRFDAVAIDAGRQHVRAYLAERGWRGETLNAGFECWKRLPTITDRNCDSAGPAVNWIALNGQDHEVRRGTSASIPTAILGLSSRCVAGGDDGDDVAGRRRRVAWPGGRSGYGAVAAQGGHLPVSDRWAVAARHVRHEAERTGGVQRRVQPDCDRHARHPNL